MRRTATQILEEVRGRASLGSPLYRFQLQAAETELLLPLARSAVGYRADSLAKAAYCLVAARVLCSSYAGGAWSWAPVDELLGTPRNRESIVETGLRRWRRNVVVTNGYRQWLLTLASEGGLPLGMLADDRNQFSEFFHRLLALAERYPDEPVSQLVPTVLPRLATTLQNEAVSSLASDLIEAVKEFRRLTFSSESKLEALEAVDKAWRTRLPVDVRDDVALTLIEGLLRAKSPVLQSKGTRAVRVVTRMVEGATQEFSLKHTLNIPVTVKQLDLLQQLGVVLKGEEAPAHFRVSLIEAEGVVRPLFVVSRGNTEGTYALEPLGRSRHVHFDDGLEPVVLQAQQEGTALGAPVRVSEELGLMPWVFDGDDFELLSVGPCRTTRSYALVALPGSASLRVESEGDAEVVGSIPSVDRKVWLLTGTGNTECDGDGFKICTGADSDVAESLRLLGNSITLNSGLVWLGTPEVYRDEGVCEVPVPRHLVQWRPKADRGSWLKVGDACLGDVQLRVLDTRGTVIHRTTLTVLPRSFSFSIRPMKRTRAGQIVLRGTNGALVGVSEGSPFDVRLAQDSGESLLEVEAPEGVEMTEVAVLLRWGQRQTLISLPFPAEFLGFVGHGGRPLFAGDTISVDRSFGVRARAVAPVGRHDFLLMARARGLGELKLGRLKSIGDGRHELALDHVQDRVEALLAGGLDADVELFVAEQGGVFGKFRRDAIHVRWYRYALRRTALGDDGEELPWDAPVTNRWRLDWPAGIDEALQLRAEAHRLADPGRVDVLPLERAVGGWIFDARGLEQGPWLATVWRGDSLAARPLLLTVGLRQTSAELPSHRQPSSLPLWVTTDQEEEKSTGAPLPPLVRAIAISDREDRTFALRSIAKRLAKDANHPDWPLALSYLESVGEFPTDTYHFVRVLAYRPDALALGMLKLSDSGFQAVWNGVEDFHFLWAAFPVDSWVKAVQTYRDTALGDMPPELQQLMMEDLKATMMRRASLSRAWDVLVDVIARRVQGFPAPAQSILAICGHMTEMVKEEIHRMATTHADEEWPMFQWKDFAGELPWDQIFSLIPIQGQFHRGSLLTAPAVAAGIASSGVRPTHEILRDLRYARSFDEPYFDLTYSVCLARLLVKIEIS